MIQRGIPFGETMSKLPTKITPDSIREALFEMRFEHAILPEIAVGKLAGRSEWESFVPNRLPFAEMPEQLRLADPAFRYVPTLELRSPDGVEIVRVGPYVISHHVVGSYIGWDSFRPKLLSTAGAVLRVLQSSRFTRFGLRYVNALTRSDHFVATIHDLNLNVTVAGHWPSESMQLAYVIEEGDLAGVVRIVTPHFVDGEVPAGTAALVDIDVATIISLPSPSVEEIDGWLDRAHDLEKREFFNLLSAETLMRLTEK